MSELDAAGDAAAVTDEAASAAASAAEAAAQSGGRTVATVGKGRTAAVASGSGAVRGVTASAITIGDMASENINSAAAAFGATGLTFPDPKTQVEPLVKWVNDHGGVAGGRKLQVAWHFRDDLSGDTDAAKMQAACNDFAQDKEVFLVTSVYSGHNMAPCLAAAGIPLVESGAGPPHYGIPTYDSLNGYYVTPNQISVDRYASDARRPAGRAGFLRQQRQGRPDLHGVRVRRSRGRAVAQACVEAARRDVDRRAEAA